MKIISIMSVGVAAAASLLLSLSAVSAQELNANKWYVGFGYDAISADYSSQGVNFSADFAMIKSKVGYEWHEFVDVEAHFGLGIQGDSMSVSGVDVEADLDAGIGVYVKPNYDVFEGVNVYGILGFTTGKLSASASAGGLTATASDHESDVSYGFGAQVVIKEAWSAYVEYISYVDKEEFSYSGVGFGVVYSF